MDSDILLCVDLFFFRNDRIYCLVDHNQVSQSPVAKYDIPRDQMKGK